MLTVAIIAMALLGLMTSLDSAGRLTLTAQRHEQAISVGQQEIERLRAYAYAQLDHASRPSQESSGIPAGDPHPEHPFNPNYYVQGAPGTHFEIRSDYKNSASAPPSGFSAHPGGPANAEPLVDAVSGGAVEAGPETVEVGTTVMKVWRYVTWRRDPRQSCSTAPCRHSKRITVAVRPEPSPGIAPTRPIFVSTVVVPPPGT